MSIIIPTKNRIFIIRSLLRDLAQRLMDAGFDVNFADMEARAQFDLLFSRDVFSGEVECKLISVDAGRQIYRKDFYRFMEALSPALKAQRGLHPLPQTDK